MTDIQKGMCRKIIHRSAALAGLGNLLPVPAMDVFVDITILGIMTRRLGIVLSKNITKELAKNFVLAMVKRQLVARITKAVVKNIPVLGWIVGPVLGVIMMELTGWEMVNRLDKKEIL